MDKVIKKKWSGTRHLLLFRLRNKFTKISLLVIYYLTKFDGVIFISTLAANLCKPIHDIINYSISICPFESGKCGKEEQKLQNLGNEKSFLDEIKTFFIVFQGLSVGEKIKIY